MPNKRIDELGIDLAVPVKSIANYVPFKLVGDLVYISGQLPISDGHVIHKGKLGADVPLETGITAARLCAINVLTQLRVACEGDLSKVAECVRLAGFINCTDTFTEQPKVMNGASDIIVDVFGDAGRHSRVAVGVNALPLGAAVEVEAIFRLHV